MVKNIIPILKRKKYKFSAMELICIDYKTMLGLDFVLTLGKFISLTIDMQAESKKEGMKSKILAISVVSAMVLVIEAIFIKSTEGRNFSFGLIYLFAIGLFASKHLRKTANLFGK